MSVVYLDFNVKVVDIVVLPLYLGILDTTDFFKLFNLVRIFREFPRKKIYMNI